MKRLAIAAVAVFAFAGTLTATAKQPITAGVIFIPAPPPECTAPVFKAFSGDVWKLKQWRRGKPPEKTIEAMERRIGCAASPSHRKAMKKTWRRDKKRFKRHRAEKLDDRRFAAAISPPGMAVLRAIASCESGGDPTAVSPDGSYRGKYQFSFSTWESVGGTGDPAAAPEREQDERAAALYRITGPSSWPVCGV